MKKQKRGPKPKPKKEVKQAIRIYKETWKIEELGGLESCQEIASESIENKVKKLNAKQTTWTESKRSQTRY